MEVNCEGCAGCCIDWRPIASGTLDHERRGPRRPIDDAYNLVPLTRDEVRAFVDAGYGDAMTPRLWHAESEESVTVDGVDVAAIDGRPVFFVGLRKPPKPVGPFGTDRTWLSACAFLDPETLQCRIHGEDLYPAECAEYPGHNLLLDRETECERVEREWGGDRLLNADPPAKNAGLLLGPQALGSKVFAHPDPAQLSGVVGRLAAGETTAEDRATFIGVAVGSHPGSLDVDEAIASEAREAALAADSWVSDAIDVWTAACPETGAAATDAPDATDVEHGAPRTPGW